MFGGVDSDPFLYLAIALLVAFVVQGVLSYLSQRKSGSEQERPMQILVVVTCTNCGHSETTNFTEGMFVGRVVGSCPKCGGKLIVSKIFTQPIQQSLKTGPQR